MNRYAYIAQSQLLLIALASILVGLAVVTGLQAFSRGAEADRRDALAAACVRAATDAQAWYLRPRMLGGGERSWDGDPFAGRAATGVEVVERDGARLALACADGEAAVTVDVFGADSVRARPL